MYTLSRVASLENNTITLDRNDENHFLQALREVIVTIGCYGHTDEIEALMSYFSKLLHVTTDELPADFPHWVTPSEDRVLISFVRFWMDSSCKTVIIQNIRELDHFRIFTKSPSFSDKMLSSDGDPISSLFNTILGQ